MSSVFGRLGFNFDTNAFGDAQYLTPAALKTMNASPVVMKSWQESDLAAGTTSKDRYFQNPHATICASIAANATLIKEIADGTTGVEPLIVSIFTNAPTEAIALSTACSNLIIELTNFKNHTDNISGLGVVSTNSSSIPNYDLAVSVGQQILRITNATDDVANSTPMLGSFTSLFIGDELQSNSAIIYNDMVALNTASSPTECLYTPTQVNQLITHITTANTMIATRRTHDWNFYEKSVQVVNDYMNITRFDHLGNTQTYLVNNFIGTDTLVNNLANG